MFVYIKRFEATPIPTSKYIHIGGVGRILTPAGHYNFVHCACNIEINLNDVCVGMASKFRAHFACHCY